MKKPLFAVSKLALILLCICLTAMTMLMMVEGNDLSAERTAHVSDNAVMDRYDHLADACLEAAYNAAKGVNRVFWLRDEDQIAPKPNPANFGTSRDASELGWLLEEAAELLDGQETLFTTETKIVPGTEIIYYLDETILSITWKQAIDGGMYTISEVKIAHPSQLRRYLAGGSPDSNALQITTVMARYVNAVTASNGDFYRQRPHGINVYDGKVIRVASRYVDTCYITDEGDMLFSYPGELTTYEEAQRFVDENNIRFSLSFGPVIKDGDKINNLSGYVLGQGDETYARAVLCQKGKLHYIVAALNREGMLDSTDTIYGFAENVLEWDVENAYTLDGGQTAVIVTNNQLINNVVKGHQRAVSDIFYFATAIPEGN